MIALVENAPQTAKVDGTIARALVEFVQKKGVSLLQLVRRCDFLLEILENRSRFVSHSNMKRLWKVILELTPDSHLLGLYFGNSFKVLMIGSLEVLAQKCETLLDGLYKGCALNFFTAIRFSFTDNGDEIILEFFPDTAKEPGYEDVFLQSQTAFAVGVVHVLRVLAQKHILPLQTYLPFPAPAEEQLYREAFGGEVKFGQKVMCLRFRKQDLTVPITYKGGAATFHAHAGNQHVESFRFGPFSKVVLRAIERGFGKEVPVLETVASELHMTARSLQRKLSAEGTSFSNLQEEVRRKLALELMQNAFFSLGEISDKLGYANISAFSRVFKKWAGMSPSEFRQTLKR